MFRRHHPPVRDPGWDTDSTSPRVLIENRDGATAWAQRAELERAGFRVALCDGPDPAHQVDCSLVSAAGCDLVAGADVVVCGVDVRCGLWPLLDALKRQQPDRSIVRECSAQELVRHPEIASRVEPLPFPAQPGELAETVRNVLAR